MFKRPEHPATRAFTLVEVIVAVTIVALLAAVVSIRITGTKENRVTLLVDQLRDLLTMYAMRSEHSPEPVAIMMQADHGVIGLVRREPPAYQGAESEWARDPSVPWIKLPDFMELSDVEVLADGDWIDIVEWPLVAMPGENRPAIEFNLTLEERVISLRLPPHSIYASRHDSDMRDSGLTPRDPVDLDQTGRWQEDWKSR
ncbi:MAG: hypothetical protein CMJ29_05165 [Phycisphaerae bacterium]|nr:hypothetical protein [Phycisphaerae bacterium]